jgi:calcium/calmodulin-dependent protein kinase (CaM kinase) II
MRKEPAMPSDPATKELLALNQKLLESIARADWQTYQQLCDLSLTCFEPEAAGHLVEGLPFHEFYFKLGGAKGQHETSMSCPHVRIMGDVAVVSYVRLNQRQTNDGSAVTLCVAETRVWQRQDGRWRHVHFHRSPA